MGKTPHSREFVWGAAHRFQIQKDAGVIPTGWGGTRMYFSPKKAYIEIRIKERRMP